MSDFSHLFCFYPRLPTWSTWVSELRYHISHVSCLLYTCPALFIMELSAPGVRCQAGSDSFGLTSAAAVLEGCCTSRFIEQAGPATGATNGNLKATQWRNSEETGSQSSSEDLELLTPQEDKREFNWRLPYSCFGYWLFQGRRRCSIPAGSNTLNDWVDQISVIHLGLSGQVGNAARKRISATFHLRGFPNWLRRGVKMLFSNKDLLPFLNC